jgi:hypothetical protein
MKPANESRNRSGGAAGSMTFQIGPFGPIVTAGVPARDELALQIRDAGADALLAQLHVGVAALAATAPAAGVAERLIGPDSGRLVREPRDLDLQPRQRPAGALFEDAEDDAGAVDHLDSESLLQPARLARADGTVDDERDRAVAERAPLLCHQRGQLLELAGADDSGRGAGAPLHQHTHDADAEHGEQPGHLGGGRVDIGCRLLRQVQREQDGGRGGTGRRDL